MNKEEKRKMRLRILNIQDDHCKGCTKVPKYSETSKNHKTSWCTENCEIGRTLKKLGDSLDEGRTGNMGEERNWDQICAKAEQLRAEDKKKWTWGNIAEQFGVTEGNLYYHISRRREANKPSEKRVGATKQPVNTKPLATSQNAEKTKIELPKLKSIASSHLSKETSLNDSWKERLNEIIDEKDMLIKEVSEVSKQYSESLEEIERLKRELLAETKLRLQTEQYVEFYEKQYREIEEDYNFLKNDFNAVTEKDFEQRAEIKKLHEQLQISHTELEKERAHRLELQGRSQALGMALKAVL